MRIQWATICRYGELTASGLSVLGAGQNLVVASALPGDVELCVAGMITDFATLPATATLHVGVAKDDETLVTSMSWQIQADLVDEIKYAPNIPPSIGFAMPLRFQADTTGTYHVGIGLDNEPPGILPLAIVLDRPVEDELQELL